MYVASKPTGVTPIPGINALTLMSMKAPRDGRFESLLPVVRYSLDRRLQSGVPDYWDFATSPELAVLASDEAGATEALKSALAATRESWEPTTTADNIKLVRESLDINGEAPQWIASVEEELRGRSPQFGSQV